MALEIGESAFGHILDRRVPKDWKHVEKYPLRSLRAAIPLKVDKVERLLDVPRQYVDEYDQGKEGACVGYSQSWMMSILYRRCYDAYRLYATAQGIDEWPETPPEEGTSNRAGFEVLRTIGHWRIWAGQTRSPMLEEGISEYRWIANSDEGRAVIAAGLPLNLGIWWYDSFDRPETRARFGDKPSSRRKEYWLPMPDNVGAIRGGHAITAVAASDARQAFALCNTWGASYPFLVWLPYKTFDWLMGQDGECGVVTDRIKGDKAIV
jgi:hypothetical protein